MLWTLNRYRTFGFRPEPGTVVESLDASMSWKSCVVTHTYVEMNDTADGADDLTMMVTVTQDSGINDVLSQGNDLDEVTLAPFRLLRVVTC